MSKKLKNYLASINGVVHTTFNPKGPGVVRIHLVPPKKVKLGVPWVIIVNGQDILPVTCGWAILLKIFIDSNIVLYITIVLGGYITCTW